MGAFWGSLMNDMMVVFLIAVLGYLLGRIEICGIRLGTSGVLLVALVFGHFGKIVPGALQNFGLICFVTSVGFIAGPVFFQNFKQKAFAYIFLGFFVVTAGAIVTALALVIFKTPLDVTIGLFTGAMTSTPGLAAAKEVAGELAATGYAIAYPFGVVGVVLFVQLMPKIFKADIAGEVARLSASASKSDVGKSEKKKLFQVDKDGFAAFAFAVVLGLILGKISIPLGEGMSFSLGTTGGPLIMGLVVGHFRQMAGVTLEVPKATLETFREMGLMLFLMGAGTTGGQGFVAVLKEHGIILFFIGAAITLIPMMLSYVIARKMFKMEMLNGLGSICGGMTSTPALGTLIAVAQSSTVATSYAATYPIALLMVVLSTQVLTLIFG